MLIIASSALILSITGGIFFVQAKIAVNSTIQVKTGKRTYSLSEEVKIEIKNNSKKYISILPPYYYVEMFTNNEWNFVYTLNTCPCEAQCKVSGPLALKGGKVLDFTWDQRTKEKCRMIKTKLESTYLTVPKGKYRIKIDYSYKTNLFEAITDKHQSYSNVFIIK